MNASRIHSLIAAGLDNPQLLTRWRQEPGLLRGYGVDPEQFDLEALWKFAGLAAKIRHNGLRADLPLTFRLLSVTGLEIEVFASYASFRAAHGGSYAQTSEARSDDLLAFLKDWLNFDQREHVLLWDLLRYELALMRLNRPVDRPAESHSAVSSARPTPRPTSKPRICGEIVLLEMSCHPGIVGRLLQEKSPQLLEVPLGSFHFCYWRKGRAAEVAILELDELGFYLLSLIDGKRSMTEISGLMTGIKKPTPGFLQASAELAMIGILSFD